MVSMYNDKEDVKILKEINNKPLCVNDLVIPLYFGVRESKKENFFGIVVSENKIWCNYNGDYRLKTCEYCLKVEKGELGEFAKEQYNLLVDSYIQYRNKKLSKSKFKSSDLKPGQLFKVLPQSKHSAFYCYIYLGQYNISMHGHAEYKSPYAYMSKKEVLDYSRLIDRKYIFLRYVFYSESSMNDFINDIVSNQWDVKSLMSNENRYSNNEIQGLEPVDKLPSNLELINIINISELNDSVKKFDVYFKYTQAGPSVYLKQTYYGYAYLTDININFSRKTNK